MDLLNERGTCSLECVFWLGGGAVVAAPPRRRVFLATLSCEACLSKSTGIEVLLVSSLRCVRVNIVM